jgi:CBS domain-containing protein
MILPDGSVNRLTMSDIMTRDVIAVEPENTLREVLDALIAHGITGAPVISSGHVLGVITRADIVEFLASTPAVPSLRPQLAEWGEIESDREETPDEESCNYFRGLWQDSSADVV